MSQKTRLRDLEQAGADPADAIAIAVEVRVDGKLAGYQFQGERIDRTEGETEEALADRVRAKSRSRCTVLMDEAQMRL